MVNFRNAVEGFQALQQGGPKHGHPGPSLNLAIGAALLGVVIALILFFIYRPAPSTTFALVLVLGGGATMLALGASFTRQWMRNR